MDILDVYVNITTTFHIISYNILEITQNERTAPSQQIVFVALQGFPTTGWTTDNQTARVGQKSETERKGRRTIHYCLIEINK